MAGRPKTRAERLSPADIVAAALEVLSADGVEGLTMRTLATELQVSIGAVYNHISGRDQLLDLVVEHILLQVSTPSEPTEDGWAVAYDYAMATQAMLDQYPGLDTAVISRATSSPVAHEMRRQLRAALERSGLGRAEAEAADRAIGWLWLGSRVALGGRPQRPIEAEQFRMALVALIEGLQAAVSEHAR